MSGDVRVAHVCGLATLSETVAKSGATHLISLLGPNHEFSRPPQIAAHNHLHLTFNDIAEPREGYISPGEQDIVELIAFGRSWHQEGIAPIVIHCWFGISRSTAGAYILACLLQQERSEQEIADELRARSPSATPNPRLVALADQHLQRDGRMVHAIAAIGRGAHASSGTPFEMPLE
ncbi:MAG: tyrosine protein phosphatase [Pseudomonadota bacterium]